MKKNIRSWQGTTAVIGVDWGDSGKGRLVDDLAQNAQIIARYNGGSNTGHTIKNKFGKFAFHIIPSGIFNPKATNVIGRNVVVDLESLIDDELKQLKNAGIKPKNLVIDEQANLTMPWHKMRDGLREKMRSAKIGTTGRGVGPAYADRIERAGLQIKDLVGPNFRKKLKDELDFQNQFFKLKLSFEQIAIIYSKFAQVIKPYVGKTIPLVKQAIARKQSVLFEGAQGYFLDVDAGTYPYVTSSNTGVIGIWRSFDVHPSEIKRVIGITKAYTTRVGAGPMPTRMTGQEREIIIEKGHEIGTTSGRTRDPGWLDLVLLKAAVSANLVTSLAITKMDVFSGFKNLKLCTAYQQNGKKVEYISGDADYLSQCQPVYETLPGWQEDIKNIREFEKLPKNAKDYIKRIEKFAGVPVNFIGVGPERSEVIYA